MEGWSLETDHFFPSADQILFSRLAARCLMRVPRFVMIVGRRLVQAKLNGLFRVEINTKSPLDGSGSSIRNIVPSKFEAWAGRPIRFLFSHVATRFLMLTTST